MTAAMLARLLREAAEAHHSFEQAQGKPDANWPEWYADYIVNKLPPELPERETFNADPLDATERRDDWGSGNAAKSFDVTPW